ncbi:unnamed protein product [Amoebophrya sp. A25]|nr:unnamed protein product [Amoebophrya sp. A25]CAD7971580.1 unnamed protein product [Amoebophrya sp. A25]|eukprot:GSA25T00023721001.1
MVTTSLHPPNGRRHFVLGMFSRHSFGDGGWGVITVQEGETPNDEWQHVAISYDHGASTNIAYTGGKLAQSGKPDAPPNTKVGEGGPFVVGGSPLVCIDNANGPGACCKDSPETGCLEYEEGGGNCDAFLLGDIAQVAVYDKALTAEQVLFLATSTTTIYDEKHCDENHDHFVRKRLRKKRRRLVHDVQRESARANHLHYPFHAKCAFLVSFFCGPQRLRR